MSGQVRKVLLIPIFAVSVFLISFSMPDVHATTYTITDQNSCQSIGGFWVNNGIDFDCTVTNLNINSGDKITIPVLAGQGGNEVTYVNLVVNSGTITINSGGELSLLGALKVNQGGIIINDGTLDTTGTTGVLLTSIGSTIINRGNLVTAGFNVINSGTIDNSGSFTNAASFSNTGIINEACGSSITLDVSIQANQPVSDCDPTATIISPKPSQATPGIPITLGATVADSTNQANIPAGTVSWSSNGGSFSPASCTLSNGACTVSYTASNTIGLSTITANYLGTLTDHSSSDSFTTQFSAELKDLNSCQIIGGSWISGTNTCAITNLTINSGGTLQIDNGITLANSGTITINSGGTIYNLGTVSNAGTMQGSGLFKSSIAAISNSGTISDPVAITDSSINTSTSPNFPVLITSGQTTTINSGTTLTINAGNVLTINSGGTLQIDGGVTLANSGTITINSGGTLTISSAGTISSDGTLSNTGTVNNGGTFSNAGTLDVNTGPNASPGSGPPPGGAFSNSGALSNTGTINIGATDTSCIEGFCFTTANGGNLSNSGSIDNCGGTISGTISGTQSTNKCPTTTTVSPNPTSTFPDYTVTYTATVTDTSPSPTTPGGIIIWNDGGTGGTFANSGSCTLSGSGSTSTCTITYTTPPTTTSVIISGSYGGDSVHIISSGTSHLAVQTATTISDQNSCELLGGSWTPGSNSQASTCAITSNITIGSGDTLNIDSNIDLQINPSVTLANSGTINNSNSNSFINDLGTIVNGGTINDNFVLIVHGQLTNNGAINVNGNELEVYGTLDNKGHIVFTSGSDLFNTGTITNECGSDISGTYLLSGSKPANQVCDTIPPTLTISEPSDNAILDHLLSVNGTASDDTSVSSVTGKVDNGITSAATTTDNFAHWSFATIGLSTGSHTIEINATDSAGLITTQSVSITINDCQSGTYLSGNQCVQAPPGSYVGTAGATSATQCASGSYQPNVGSTSCLQADPGNFVSGSGATAETQCVTGTFQPNAGSTSCNPADLGSFVGNQGSTSEQQCPAGTFTSIAGQSVCTPAPAGSYATGPGATSATLCPVGKYSANSGSASCTPSPAGSYVGTTGAASSTLCAPGSYQPSTGQTSCILASPGFFVSSSGATQQTQCPANTTSDNPGSTACRPLTPTEQTNNLINTVKGMNLDQGTVSSLDAKLDAALSSLNSGDGKTAQNQLNAFINEVNAQTGKKINTSDAGTLIPAVQNIINSIH